MSSLKRRRSTRAGAGKKGLASGFVDPSEVLMEPESSSDYDSDSNELEGVKHRRWSRKRPRVSPAPRELSEEPAELDKSQKPNEKESVSNGPTEDVKMVFNIPAGHQGPFIVNLNLGSLFCNDSSPTQHMILSDPQPLKPVSSHKTGFLDIPAEIRNAIYQLALVRSEPIRFPPRKGQRTRSSALLATCRQVSHEGAEVLYGSNIFHFFRNNAKRGRFFEDDWKTVGWKDIRVFLQTIGAKNIANMRKLVLVFEDGNSEKDDIEDAHRFVNDNHLMEVLKQLALSSQLRYLGLSIHPRKKIHRSDHRFIENLQKIKADKVRIIKHPDSWYKLYHEVGYWTGHMTTPANMERQIQKKLLEKMQREFKLYPANHDDDSGPDT